MRLTRPITAFAVSFLFLTASAQGAVRINEWMALNASTIRSGDPDSGEYAPWIELYNDSPTAFALLEGYSITDDLSEPTKYQFQPDFDIPPGGFLLVWADGRNTEAGGEIHTNFELNSEGGSIALTGPDGVVTESITYGPQRDDISEGRWPDGTGSVYTMPLPTPGTNNTLGPIITVPPEDQAVALLGTATFSVTAIGLPPLTYQWFRGDVPLTGATNSTLTLSNVIDVDANSYFVVVENGAGTQATSGTVLLAVVSPPTIVSQPSSLMPALGARFLRLTVNAIGDGLRYQWHKNGIALPGGDGPDLDLPRISLADGGAYTVSVYNEAGAVLSNPATLIVNVPSSPEPADEFKDGVTLTEIEGALRGSITLATREEGEPFHGYRVSSKSVWYSWQAPDRGIMTVATTGSTFDTLLAVYTGTDLTNLKEVATDDDRGSFRASRIQFNAIRDQIYHIAIAGFELAEGDFLLSWALEDTSETIPSIVEDPASQAVPLGGDVVFRARTDSEKDSYQWYFNGNLIPGATLSSLELYNVQSSNVGQYDVLVQNDQFRFVYAKAAHLQIGKCPNAFFEDKYQSFALNCNNSLWSPISLQSGAPPTDTNALTQGTFLPVDLGEIGQRQAYNTNNSAAVNCQHNVTKRLWGYFTAEDAGTIEFDSAGSPTTVDLVLYQYVPNPLDLPNNVLDCDFVSSTFNKPSRVRHAATQGQRFAVLTAGYQGADGLVRLNYRLGTAPNLNQALQTHQVMEGGQLLLQAQAGGIPPPLYQWYRDGAPITGSNSPSLLLDNLQCGDAALYSVSASNWVGAVQQNVADVQVTVPFRLSAVRETNGLVVGVELTGKADHPFVVEMTDQFPANWLPLATNPLPCVPFILFLPDPQFPSRFYRGVKFP